MRNEVCKKCLKNFEITSEDLEFYSKISPTFAGKKYALPSPTHCPNCRYQRRLTHRNERNLYRRKCSATEKDIVSIFSPDKSIKVFAQDYWWSDHWNAKDYAREFDFNRSFFDQFKDLLRAVPQIALNNARSENCEFTNQSQDNKNSYLIVASNHNEDCYFGMWLQQCLNCMDCLYLERSELCYEVVNGKNCYRVFYSENVETCSESYFLKNCTACKNCFGCVNLRNKEYYFFNEPCTKEEYFQKIAAFNPHDLSNFENYKEKFKKFSSSFVSKHYQGKSIENSCGDYIQEVKNTFYSYNCRKCEDIKYCYDAWDARNCHDLTETLTNDVCLELEGSVYNQSSAFSMKIDRTSDVFYCSHCYTGQHLFGCIGLRNAEYCILNKQYTKEEYETLVPRAIEHMQKRGEWGEHFPPELSFFGYNETVAQEYFPLTQEEAIHQNYSWKNAEQKNENQIVSTRVLACNECQKNYKIISQEFELYQKINLPLPKRCPDCRHQARMEKRNPRKLWQRSCSRCSKSIQTTYSTDSPEIICCEECYLKEVY